MTTVVKGGDLRTQQRVVDLRYVGDWGSQEHFFHYVWGYLVPALAPFLSGERVHDVLRFESCGPVMDDVTRHVCAWLGVPFAIASSETGAVDTSVDHVREVPRWDIWLRGTQGHAYRSRMRLFVALGRLGLRHAMLERMERAIVALRTRALERDAAPDAPPEGSWLLLRRSPEPEFYRVDGPARNARYGVGRRAIANFDELEGRLVSAGLAVHAYEPGRDPFDEQIRVFERARGVIAIRGAEFANVAWMRPGATVVMLVTPIDEENNLSANLAISRQLRFRPIRVTSDHPTVDADRVLRAIR